MLLGMGERELLSFSMLRLSIMGSLLLLSVLRKLRTLMMQSRKLVRLLTLSRYVRLRRLMMPKEWIWLLAGVVIGAYVLPMVMGMVKSKTASDNG